MIEGAPLIDADSSAWYRQHGWWRDRTFVDDFLDVVDRLPGKTALVAHTARTDETTRLTYRELAELVDRIAAGLMELGVRPREIVSYQLPNWWQFTALTLACARIGAVVNPIMPILRHKEMRHILGALKSRVCVVPRIFRGFDHGTMLANLAAELPDLRHVFTIGEPADGQRPFGEFFLAPDRPRVERALPAGDDIAEIQFTSGTTGSPKGVVHTYNTIYASYRAVLEPLSLGEDDVVLMPSPMGHQTGFLNGCCMVTAEGMTAVYLDEWNPVTMLRLLEQERATYTAGATPFMVDTIAAAEAAEYDTSSLRYFKSGGAAVPVSIPQRMQEIIGAQVVMSWGMTENGVCTITPAGSTIDEVAGSDGFPLSWVELKVVGLDTGEPVEQGADGLLYVKSASQCVDYFPDHDLYVAAQDGDGWFNTGDLARIQDDGSLRITGRVKEMIIRGGENVPVAEVEAALSTHPGIKEVALVAVPDERLGERGCVVVVPSDGTADVSLRSLTGHLAGIGMAKQYWPEFVLVQNSLPRTASGKIRKPDLRQMAQEKLLDDGGRPDARAAVGSPTN